MDRETRKANFKKLQQPATTKLRTTRSSKAVAATSTLSDYFSSQEATQVASQPPKSAEKNELFVEPRAKKTRESHDIKPASTAKPKKAPKLKSAAPARRGRGRSKQSSISDFLRNEQLFAEVTAQHCAADNFSPDDIEMALALSKSEAEKHGILRLQDTMDCEKEQEEVVDMLEDQESQTTENIRRKLQKYGFQTAAKEDYNMLSIGILPGTNGKRSKRCKWANKFTALTLRKPETQLKKRDTKVAALMAQQVRTRLPSPDELQTLSFQLISARLEALKAAVGITHEPSEGSITNLSDYYVEELFEVSKTPADHLLKNWTAIQGRDLSPKRRCAASHLREQHLEKVYAELEAHFGEDQAATAMNTSAEEAELDELEKLLVDNMVEESEISASPLKEPPDKRARTEEEQGIQEIKTFGNDEAKENQQPSSSIIQLQQREITEEGENQQASISDIQPRIISEEQKQQQPSSSTQRGITEEKLNLEPSSSATQLEQRITEDKEDPKPSLLAKGENLQSSPSVITPEQISIPKQSSISSLPNMPRQTKRCISPDLFADSDDEASFTELKLPQNVSLSVYKDSTSKEIKCYEIYSSDEVKTPTEPTVERMAIKSVSPTPFVESFVDLTEDTDSLEYPITVNSENSILAPEILEFDEELDVLNCTLANHIDAAIEDCVISEELYAKYTHKEDQGQQDITVKSSSSVATFQMPIGNSPLSFKDTSLTTTSFQLAITPNSSKENSRSFNLTPTPNGKHSFKSPLSRSSSSFTEIPNSTSFKSPLNLDRPTSMSDASIDLTQDSCDEDDALDDNGVLLSDDEINYSIWQANKTQRNQEQALLEKSISPLTKRKTLPYFKTLEDLDAYLDTSPVTSIKPCNSRSPNQSALSRERAEFGILDAALSQPFTLSQLPSEQAETSQVNIDWTDASFLDTATEVNPMKHYSTGSHKFQELIHDLPNPVEDELDELDEFDRMVFENVKATAPDTVPSGMDRLLLGDINLDSLPECAPPVPSPASQVEATAKPELPEQPQQLDVNGQLYTVRVCTSPKPDYLHMSESKLLQHLYNYGIKPLNRKNAVKLLEFIYNQTHPIMVPLEESQPLPRSKSTPVSKSRKPLPLAQNKRTSTEENLLSKQPLPQDCLTPPQVNPATLSCKFRDAPGSELLRFSQAVPPALCDDFECYVLQTNVTKKTPQPLLPLHIAWHNLICANPSLHESVLMFEPIDLQEIYQYLKQLGHRYDPKDLKCFFDRRCIIFRYELAPQPQARHVPRRKPKKPSFKF